GAVVVGTPRQTADLHPMHSGHHRPLAAREFERVAAYEAARAVLLVEFLAPDTIPGTAIPVQLLVEISGDPRIGMEHHLPTRPLELARPLGNRADAEFSRMRAVPIALQARMTTSAG